jgi:5,10-methylenetetrahydromethanopterin reductase
MRLGLFSTAAAAGTIDDIIAEARRAEVEGFDSFWVPQIFGWDAITVLALIGAEVPRIELGTSVVPTYPRHPMMLAQQAHTANAASGGRLALGIGLSHRIVIESMMGMNFERPVRHLRDYLSVLMPLVRGEAVAFDGELYRTHAALGIPDMTPFPVLIAALGPQMLAATGELADGTITWCTGPLTLRDHIVPTLNQATQAASRAPGRVVAALPVCVTEDRVAARERAASVFAIYGQLPSYRAMLDREGAAGPADIALIGSEDEVMSKIAGLYEIGVTEFAAVEFPGTPDEAAATREALRALLPE